MSMQKGYDLRQVRRQYYLIAGLIAVLLLGACGGRSPEPAPTLEVVPTATAVPAPTSEPQPTPTETAIALSPICSPLAEHEIATLLSLYLTQPFIPPQGANKETGHHGLDFAYYSGGPTGGHINGTPIQSMLDGVVAGMGYNAVYGYYLITETPFALLPAELAEALRSRRGRVVVYAVRAYAATCAAGAGGYGDLRPGGQLCRQFGQPAIFL